MAAKKKAKKAAAKKKAAPKRKAAPAKKRAAAKTAGAPRPAPAANTIVHWEIQARDPARQQQFYADVFGWKIDANNPMNYGMVSSGGKDAINGGIGGSPGGQPLVTVYAAVKSIVDTLAKVESLGGRTVMPRTDIGPVIMGLFTDPEGNVFGVIEG
jgi:predicted enzyme related to lactoylglutathione lyase